MQEIKKIVWETNFNKKMSCKCFIHISFPPKETLVRNAWENTEYEIETLDKSHANIKVRLEDILRLDIGKFPIPESFTLASHGLTEKEFVEYMFQKFPAAMQNTDQLAVYHYKVII